MKLFIFLMLVLPHSTFADNFEQRKTEVLTNIDQRIQKFNEQKTCVQAATNHEALKACREKMREFNQAERIESLQKQKNKLDQKIKKIEEKPL